MKVLQPKIILSLIFVVVTPWSAAAQFAWQTPQAKVLPNGDLEWAPQPYKFTTGDKIRYIDYENGNDGHSGASKEEPWKHHPWDVAATGNAAEASGVITYVFKGGTIYRGQLNANESGAEGEPIRLTCDPSWGEGRPWFFGSEKLPAQWVRANTVDHPERLPDPESVWALDLRTAGFEVSENGLVFNQPLLHPGTGKQRTTTLDAVFYGLYQVPALGDYTQIHLARTPDWQSMGKNFAMDYWHTTDGAHDAKNEAGETIIEGFTDDLWAGRNLPKDYFTGGVIWMGYRSVMGVPTPSRIGDTAKSQRGEVPFFDPEKGALMQPATPWGHGDGKLPYMIENLPQFLDSAGEFYLDEETGLLFLKLEEGVDPNDQHLELATDAGQIRIDSQKHIEISGLGFAFGQGTTVEVLNNAEEVTVRHCEFRNLGDIGLRAFVERSEETEYFMDRIRVMDSYFADIGTGAISLRGRWQWNKEPYRGHFEEGDILRNYVARTGIRQLGQKTQAVPAVEALRIQRGQVAGNIVERSFGSGIYVLGGKEGQMGHYQARTPDLPLIRILVHHNKTRDTALGVNDYGGLALWMGGVVYAWSNNIGNSPGHMPAGLFGGTRPLNLSYPLYLDGAFKHYCFNNIIWGRTTDEDDPFANTTPGYFMVFGFLNQFANNTLFRQRKGIGGSSGNRNDTVSNLFAEIDDLFIASNRIGDPSLVGGGDDATSGLRGIPSLAYAHNLFQGSAKAGYLVREREMERSDGALSKTIEADTIAELGRQMREFPIRIGELGRQVEEPLLNVLPADEPLIDLSEKTSFQPLPGSAAIDAGASYFVPWSLYGTVGEWNFTENHVDPKTVVDYHWWMSEAHFFRMMYEQIPAFDLKLNAASLKDYQPGPSEDWVHSALRFDGQRMGKVSDASLRVDLVVDMSHKPDFEYAPGEPWTVDGLVFTYPGERRKTLIVDTQNLLIEALFETAPGHTNGLIAGKHDAEHGYGFGINAEGQAEFFILSRGTRYVVATPEAVNDGQWHHVIGEIDRETGRMTLYLNGNKIAETQTELPPAASLDTPADFVVGRNANGEKGFIGGLDFLRVCRGTLADSHTTIEELYAWQTDGPFRYDFFGRAPAGEARDVGAIELTSGNQ